MKLYNVYRGKQGGDIYCHEEYRAQREVIHNGSSIYQVIVKASSRQEAIYIWHELLQITSQIQPGSILILRRI